MDTVVRLFAAIADEQDCAFELEHHTRKLRAGDTELDGDDMRGASAIRDAVRAARVLNHMSMTDAMQLAIPEHERLLYFRVDKAKGNNAPPSQAVWRRFVNVELTNGDDVGVVVPYALPGQGERTEAMAAAEATAERIFMELLARLTLAGITRERQAARSLRPPRVRQGARGQAGSREHGGLRRGHAQTDQVRTRESCTCDSEGSGGGRTLKWSRSASRKCIPSAAQHLPHKFPHTPYAKLRATATQGGRPF